MPLISFDEAATRLGTPRQTVEDWVRRGLLSTSTSQDTGRAACIDEEELTNFAEGVGWLTHVGNTWESDEARTT